ncbi:MAG: hypothetical protein GKR94_22390 [Gammaproteobacteria bacterium]|nr:hypothetical protein [Gammaproteobacteria bacterium]
MSVSGTYFVAQETHAALLMDIAGELREQLQATVLTHRLDAIARYRGQGQRETMLDQVDPDIRMALRIVLRHGECC